MSGCLSDFSPDALKPNQLFSSGDGGADGGGSGLSDGGGGTRDSGPVMGNNDKPDVTEVPVPGADSGAPSSGSETTMSVNAPPGCDFSGKWIATEHLTTSVLGAVQVARNWYYYEVSQNGTELTANVVTCCGANVVGTGLLSAVADDTQAWPSYRVRKSYAGRKGTATATASGCEVKWEEASVVHGATIEAYSDPDTDLPTTMQKANGSTPGWEDWDMDNNPGITLNISGTATGQLYAATRLTSTYSGSVEKNASLVHMYNDWVQVRSNLGSTPDPLGILRAPAGRDANDSGQFVEFAKVTDAQIGSGDARCDNAIMLADTLTPVANKVQ
jgi:hypothetical protein